VSEASWSSVRNFQKMPKQNFPVGVPGVPSVLIAGSDPDYFVIVGPTTTPVQGGSGNPYPSLLDTWSM